MRKLLYILPGLLFLTSWSVAETIESVTFNPARLGRYENLKVSDTLTTQGGINAQAVTVQSGGTVSVENSGNYQADTVDVAGQISMPSTRFVTPSMETKGTAAFVNKSSNAASEIENLNSIVRVKGNVLKLGSVTVSGATTTDYDDNSVSGLTLGGNKIPVPTSTCSNLSWISRVADDSNAYKVLGFAACSGDEEDDCKTSYGEWRSGLGMTDSCDGDFNNAFSCANAPRNQKTVCTDVKITTTDMGLGGQTNGDTESASSTTKDTCDSNNLDLYTCSTADASAGKTCVDVWVNTGESTQTKRTRPGACPNECMGETLPDTSCFSLGGNTGMLGENAWASYLAENGLDRFCKDIVLLTNPNGCHSTFKMKKAPIGEICKCPNIGGTYYLAFDCKVKYYKRKVTCGGSGGSGIKQEVRDVVCCGNETNSYVGNLVNPGLVVGGGTTVGKVDTTLIPNRGGGVAILP